MNFLILYEFLKIFLLFANIIIPSLIFIYIQKVPITEKAVPHISFILSSIIVSTKFYLVLKGISFIYSNVWDIKQIEVLKWE